MVSEHFRANLLVLLLAPLNPLLQEVLVVAICSGSQRVDALVAELPTVGVDEHGHEPVQLPVQSVDLLHHLGHGSLTQQSHDDSRKLRWGDPLR